MGKHSSVVHGQGRQGTLVICARSAPCEKSNPVAVQLGCRPQAGGAHRPRARGFEALSGEATIPLGGKAQPGSNICATHLHPSRQVATGSRKMLSNLFAPNGLLIITCALQLYARDWWGREAWALRRRPAVEVRAQTDSCPPPAHSTRRGCSTRRARMRLPLGAQQVPRARPRGRPRLVRAGTQGTISAKFARVPNCASGRFGQTTSEAQPHRRSRSAPREQQCWKGASSAGCAAACICLCVRCWEGRQRRVAAHEV